MWKVYYAPTYAEDMTDQELNVAVEGTKEECLEFICESNQEDVCTDATLVLVEVVNNREVIRLVGLNDY